MNFPIVDSSYTLLTLGRRVTVVNPRPEGYGSRLVVRSFINPRPEGYGSRLVVRSFINPRHEGLR